MNEKDDLLLKLSSILGEVLDRDGITLERTTTAPDIEGWDSLENIRFIVAVERRFSLRFTSGEVLALRNVGDFVDLIVQSLR